MEQFNGLVNMMCSGVATILVQQLPYMSLLRGCWPTSGGWASRLVTPPPPPQSYAPYTISSVCGSAQVLHLLYTPLLRTHLCSACMCLSKWRICIEQRVVRDCIWSNMSTWHTSAVCVGRGQSILKMVTCTRPQLSSQANTSTRVQCGIIKVGLRRPNAEWRNDRRDSGIAMPGRGSTTLIDDGSSLRDVEPSKKNHQLMIIDYLRVTVNC